MIRYRTAALTDLKLSGPSRRGRQTTAPAEKQFDPPAVHGKFERAAGPLRAGALALVLGDVEGGEVLGAGLVGDEVRNINHGY